LLAWLDQIQPALTVNGYVYPSYPLRLLVEHIMGSGRSGFDDQEFGASGQQLVDALQSSIGKPGSVINRQTVETFLEGMNLDEEDGRAPRQIVDELSELLHLPLKLSSEEQRTLKDDPEEVEGVLRTQVTSMLVDQSITRLVWSAQLSVAWRKIWRLTGQICPAILTT
jgi:hypothetical protein